MVNGKKREFLAALEIMKEEELLKMVKGLNIQNARKLRQEILSQIVTYENLSKVKSLTVDQFKKELEEEKRYPGMRKSLNFVPRVGAKTP